MWQKSTIIAMAVLVIALAAGFYGCGKQESPVGNQEGTTVQPGENPDYQAIAEALISGTMPQEEYNQLALWDEETRYTLRGYVLRIISEEGVEARSDVYYIVGGNGEVTSAEEINEIGRQQAEKEGLTRNLDWVLYVEVPFYSQNDPNWSSNHLGYSSYWTIGNSGCHLCCVSMLYAKWGYCPPNQCPSMYPPGLNNWAYAGCAHYAFQNGTAFIRLPQAIQYGACRPWGWITNNQIWGHLQAGHPVIAHTWQYDDNHYVVIFAHDGSRYWVKDPVKNAANQNQWLGDVLDRRVYGYLP
ncbi:MAG: hypothetical protein COY66_06155 [Candidatus Kerfeldbacteria bacterium CG_4_10_14_0_8_um_filter_42_10]|uniref:Peptidase C39-like domain-containing protein n=1 Tax=Candidatus Kerfeldbacteria bacterium CG_4_10_14_0_8_um_filter_42_10 TaxID=2014248 RepID=A0A2M7RGI6_9BACT|nr:MAG: hypothetical protein COY66_06155 [Candidatus Kerfeldbacteria bacterium CG_4_10_14_0_8_um_filter_42_10]